MTVSEQQPLHLFKNLEVRLQHSILTTVLTGMGIQTAILGVLIARF